MDRHQPRGKQPRGVTSLRKFKNDGHDPDEYQPGKKPKFVTEETEEIARLIVEQMERNNRAAAAAVAAESKAIAKAKAKGAHPKLSEEDYLRLSHELAEQTRGDGGGDDDDPEDYYELDYDDADDASLYSTDGSDMGLNLVAMAAAAGGSPGDDEPGDYGFSGGGDDDDDDDEDEEEEEAGDHPTPQGARLMDALMAAAAAGAPGGGDPGGGGGGTETNFDFDADTESEDEEVQFAGVSRPEDRDRAVDTVDLTLDTPFDPTDEGGDRKPSALFLLQQKYERERLTRERLAQRKEAKNEAEREKAERRKAVFASDLEAIVKRAVKDQKVKMEEEDAMEDIKAEIKEEIKEEMIKEEEEEEAIAAVAMDAANTLDFDQLGPTSSRPHHHQLKSPPVKRTNKAQPWASKGERHMDKILQQLEAKHAEARLQLEAERQEREAREAADAEIERGIAEAVQQEAMREAFRKEVVDRAEAEEAIRETELLGLDPPPQFTTGGGGNSGLPPDYDPGDDDDDDEDFDDDDDDDDDEYTEVSERTDDDEDEDEYTEVSERTGDWTEQTVEDLDAYVAATAEDPTEWTDRTAEDEAMERYYDLFLAEPETFSDFSNEDEDFEDVDFGHEEEEDDAVHGVGGGMTIDDLLMQPGKSTGYTRRLSRRQTLDAHAGAQLIHNAARSDQRYRGY